MDWDEMARPWLEAAPELEISFEQIFDALFKAAALSSGENVLDVGCGAGPTLIAASNAVGKTGSVTGIDIAPPLLARAAERIPANVDLIIGDAGAHPFEKASYDIVLANFGMMFFEDNIKAFSNLRRATRPGGRLAATVWGLPQDNPWFSVPRKSIDRYIADVPRPDPAGPGPMRFGDPATIRGILEASGWKPCVETLDLHLLPPGPAQQVAKLHMKVTAAMMLKGVDATDSALDQVENAIIEACRGFERNGQIKFPACIHVVTAVTE
jgi:SAM-dependent methyltransferase